MILYLLVLNVFDICFFKYINNKLLVGALLLTRNKMFFFGHISIRKHSEKYIKKCTKTYYHRQESTYNCGKKI